MIVNCQAVYDIILLILVSALKNSHFLFSFWGEDDGGNDDILQKGEAFKDSVFSKETLISTGAL